MFVLHKPCKVPIILFSFVKIKVAKKYSCLMHYAIICRFFPLIFSSLPQLLFLNVRAIRPLENRKRGPLPSSLPYTNLTTSETWSNLPMGISALKKLRFFLFNERIKVFFYLQSSLDKTHFHYVLRQY